VFQRLRTANLKLNVEKCVFASPKVEYLGHVISKAGIEPNPKKTEVIRNYPQPKKLKEVRAFLGLCNYYRKFCKDYSKIAGPLVNLTKIDVPVVWTTQCEEAPILKSQSLSYLTSVKNSYCTLMLVILLLVLF
jgi:hypothetical protein